MKVPNQKQTQRAQEYLVAFLNVMVGNNDAMKRLILDPNFEDFMICIYLLEGSVCSDQCREVLINVYQYAKESGNQETEYKRANDVLVKFQKNIRGNENFQSTSHQRVNLDYLIALMLENFGNFIQVVSLLFVLFTFSS
jgi:hypothetical protein